MKKTLQVLVFLLLSLSSFAQITWTNDFGGGDNQWSTDQNWDAVAVPSAADEVIFDGAVSNDDCFIGDFSEATNITFQNGYTGTVEIAGGATLSIYGTLSLPTAATIVINGDIFMGILSASNGTIDASGASSFTVSVDYGGTASTGGGFAISGCAFSAPSAGELLITGTISNRTAGSFTANGGTVRFAPRISKSIGSGFTSTNGFFNLTMETTGSGIVTTTVNAGGVTVNGNLAIITSGTRNFVLNTGTLSVMGNLDVSSNLANNTSNATNGSGGTATIQLAGNTTQRIIGNTSSNVGGNLPTVVIAQSSGGSITLSDRINFARNLTINSNGAISPGTSTVAFQNTAATSTISGTTTTNVAFATLILNKTGSSLSISSLSASWVTLSDLLTVTAGTLNTGNKLALLSTATNSSALVGNVGGTISGTVRVDRFINGATGRKWRFLASPVTTTGFISGNWQQSIHITGSGTGGTNCPSLTAHTNGFDATVGNSPSMYTYNEGSAAWASVANTNSTNLAPGIGYRVFVRGNRAQGCSLLDGTNPTPNDVTLSATGTLATGNQTFNPSFGTGSGWNLIGNPYQAPIDWERVTAGNRTNVEDFFQIFDPNGGIGGTGAYVTYNGATNSATGNVNQYIGPGHAFWVKANAGSASITFEEADKEVTVTGSTLFKTEGRNEHDLSIRVVDQNGYFDEVVAAFNATGNMCYDADMDIEKLQFAQGAGNIALYTSCDATRYAINAVPVSNPNVTDTLFLHIKLPAATSANYTLQFNGIGTALNSGCDVYLIDKYTNTFHNLRNSVSYSFSTIANNAATQGANRFVVVYGGNLTSLPVKLISFDAVRNGNKGELSWVTATEQNSRLFTIERSSDGKHFNEIGVVKAKGLSSAASKYLFTDGRPVLGGLNFYRLKMTDNNGSVTYSAIRTVDFSEGETVKGELITSVYPVPAQDKLWLSQNTDSEISSLIYTIYDLTGKLVAEKQTVDVMPGVDVEIALPADLKSGFYFMDLSDGRGSIQRVKFVVQ
jgi:trimeric autotransporter adhesin